MAVYGQKSIHGSVARIGVPVPFCNTGVAWTENILVPSPRWGDGVTYATWTLGNQSGVIIGDDVPWHSIFPACPAYLPISPPENERATTRRIFDALLQDHRLARAQNILYAHHIGDDGRVNWLDDDWDDLWDEPADQSFLCKLYVASVSS